MAAQGFDERYPAMFQPGGEDMPADVQWSTPAPTRPATLVDEPVDNGGDVKLSESDIAKVRPGDASAQSPWLLWRVPVMVAALMVGAGAMVPVVSWWNSRSRESGEAGYENQMWTYLAAPLATPVAGAGLGIAAALFFLYTQMHPTRGQGLRRLFTIATVAVLAAGVFAQMASHIVLPTTFESIDPDTGIGSTYITQPDFVGAISLMAFGPLLVGMLMFAALAISKNFSLPRMYFVSLLLMVAAGFSQVAQYFFPDVQSTSQVFDGGIQTIPGWPFLLPLLTPALLTAAALIIAAALLYPILHVAWLKVWGKAVPDQTNRDSATVAVPDVEGWNARQ